MAVTKQTCDLCDRVALYRGKFWNGGEILACANHRSIVTLAQTQRTAMWDARYNGAVEANEAKHRRRAEGCK